MNPKKMSLGKPAACAILLAAATLGFASPACA